jgi:replicative DNA helicase
MKKQDHSDMGKLPPQEIELEESVLGAILISKDVFYDVEPILKPAMFYKDKNSMIYDAMCILSKKNEPIDILTVTMELKKIGKLEEVGGAYGVTSMTNRVATTINTVYHALAVKQAYVRREIINACSDLINRCYDPMVEFQDCLSKVDSMNAITTENVSGNRVQTSAELFEKAIAHNDVIINSANKLSGITSGFKSIDKFTGGFQKGELTILAARPGMGKTSFALELFANPIFEGAKGLFFSLEMQNTKLFARMLSQTTGIVLNDIIRDGMQHYQILQLLEKKNLFNNSNMFFDDTSGLRLDDLKSKARKIKRKHGLDILVIDYLQLINNKQKGMVREQEISEISRELKGLAKELDIPVIALSQLGRDVEKRGGEKIPVLSDLRESGAIEQDADIVMFLHRPEYYDIKQDENGESTDGLAYLIFAKNRNGGLGKVKLHFAKTLTKFSDSNESKDDTPAQNTFTHAPF